MNDPEKPPTQEQIEAATRWRLGEDRRDTSLIMVMWATQKPSTVLSPSDIVMDILASAYRAEKQARERAEAACAAYREVLEAASHWDDTSCPDSEQLDMMRESYAKILRDETCGLKMLEREAANLARADAHAKAAEKERDEARQKEGQAWKMVQEMSAQKTADEKRWDETRAKLAAQAAELERMREALTDARKVIVDARDYVSNCRNGDYFLVNSLAAFDAKWGGK